MKGMAEKNETLIETFNKFTTRLMSAHLPEGAGLLDTGQKKFPNIVL